MAGRYSSAWLWQSKSPSTDNVPKIRIQKMYIEILRGLREDKDLRQIDIANIIDTKQQHYSKYETGEYELSLRVLAVLSDYYRVSADYIMGRTDCKESIDVLNKNLTANRTIGSFISEVYSLSDTGRRSVIEYVCLQKLKAEREK